MISFTNDYSEGACPEILQALEKTNYTQLPGYGTDEITASAISKIRKETGCPEASVHFLTGGTQANQVVIDSLLKNYEGVVAAETGHVALHEAGAIEFTGHKVLTLPQSEGKIDAGNLETFLRRFYDDPSHDHMVFPGMVYISFPTEYGTLYSEKELYSVYSVCRQYSMPLYIDGARLGYGLASEANDLTLSRIARLCDVFTIGGTKVGALCGEAVVFPSGKAPAHFMTTVKQHGALLAKGRLNAIQFDTLFTDGLYYRLSEHAVRMAGELKRIFKEKGIRQFIESPTNQQFVILSKEAMASLEGKVAVEIWQPYDAGSTVVRFATSWATREEDVAALRGLLP